MKKILISLLAPAAALLLTACSGDGEVRQFVTDFAMAVSTGDRATMEKMYPDAALAEALSIEANADSMQVEKADDGTYTVLECTDVEGEHTFTVTIVDADVTVVVALKGDANLDGVVNTKDATLVKQVYLETNTFDVDEALQTLTGDANGDGKITTKDSTLIKQVYLELNTLTW